jgi:hypothetical protein
MHLPPHTVIPTVCNIHIIFASIYLNYEKSLVMFSSKNMVLLVRTVDIADFICDFLLLLAHATFVHSIFRQEKIKSGIGKVSELRHQ